MKFFLTHLGLLVTLSLVAQNSYHQPLEINSSGQWIRSSAATGSNTDTRLLIYQYGGATMNLSGGGVGQVSNLNGAGLYDLNKVVRVGGDTLFLAFPITNSYELNRTQVIRFEGAENVSLTGRQNISQAFDGRLGGITFIAAERSIQLEAGASISVASAGFRGGAGQLSNSDCNRFTSASGETYSGTDWRGSFRGEGVADIPANQPAGRAPAANGGGGGNDHNSGGGGGANAASGGTGARNIVMGLFNNACRGNSPGRAGRGLTNDAERLYFGGGGGAGHANNTNTARGGNGGGLLVLWAPLISFANGTQLDASGEDGPLITGDGGGGGGAGGTILILSDTLTGNPELVLDGGRGSHVTNLPNFANRCFGPGGGGGGGRLITAASVRSEYQPSISVTRGGFGLRFNSSECSPNDEPAGPGVDGSSLSIVLPVPFGGTSIAKDTFCSGETVLLTDLSQGAESVDWQILPDANDQFTRRPQGTNLALDFSNQAAGTFTAIQTLSLDGRTYPGDTVMFTLLQGAWVANATLEYDGELVTASVTDPIGQSNIRYDFGDGTVIDTNVLSLSHTYAQFGEYNVSITLFNEPCGNVVVLSELLNASERSLANASLKDADGCVPLTVRINDLSTGTFSGRVWNLPGGDPGTSTDANPVVVYNEPGEYLITLTLLDGVGDDTIFRVPVIAYAQPVADASFTIDTATASFTNLSIDATEYNWNFGDSTFSMETMPAHTYAETGAYTVTLVATNGPCTDTITREVVIEVLSDVTDLTAMGVSLFPNPTNGLLTLTGPARIVGAFDLRGRVLATQGEQSLDLSGVPAGVYLVQVEAGGRMYSIRVIRR